MVHLLEDCNLCAIHAKRVTISAFFHFSTAVPVLQVAVCMCRGQSSQLVSTTQLQASWTHLHVNLIGARFLHLQCRRTCSWRGESEGQSLACRPTDRIASLLVANNSGFGV
jgi:hypothetical protein